MILDAISLLKKFDEEINLQNIKEAFDDIKSKSYPSDETISQYLYNEFELTEKLRNKAIKLIEQEKPFM